MGTNFKGSTDASVWAKAFIEHKERNGWALDNIDEDLMIGWFANFWSACQLEHDKTKAQLDRAMEVVQRNNYKNYGDSPYAKQLLSNDRIYIKEGK